MAKEEAKGLGIGGFICSILGIILFLMPYFAIILSIVGIVLSVMQNKKSKTGLATAGLVLGILGVLLNGALLLLVLMVVLGSMV